MSATSKIWLSIHDLAAALGQNPQYVEQLINDLEADLTHQTKPQRDALRREMIFIVAHLSRLESRLMMADGPLSKNSP